MTKVTIKHLYPLTYIFVHQTTKYDKSTTVHLIMIVVQYLLKVPVDELLPVGTQRKFDVEAFFPSQLGGDSVRLAGVRVIVLPRPCVLLVLVLRIAHSHRPSAVMYKHY